MHFLIGDLQGCAEPLDRLLDEIGFSPSRDRLHVLGDLVNRGPASLRVLERLHAFGDAATSLLGNHDLHLLALAHGVRKPGRGDTLELVLASPSRAAWLDWLRHQKLADTACGWLMVHAGVVPQWDAEKALALAGEVETMLRGVEWHAFLRVMYGNEPDRWDEALEGADRWRFIVNTLTRIRFCSADGTLEFKAKEGAEGAPEGFMPWFEVPGRKSESQPIAFGHWSTLGLINRPDLLALDTGCVWGGCLSAARIDGGRREVFEVRCAQSQAPG